MIALLSTLALAQESCSYVGLYGALDDLAPPAIVVVGERKGTPLDLHRADRIIGLLARREVPVTVAFEAIESEFQPVLEEVERGLVDPTSAGQRVSFADRWGFSFDAYAGLLERGLEGVDLVAAGLPYGLKPANETVPVPPGYYFALSASMGDAPVPVSFEETLTSAFAWRSHQIAATALAGWNGEGYLVIVADRALVEGGQGVSWQAERLADVAVRSVVLANAQSPCAPGDRVWRDLWGR